MIEIALTTNLQSINQPSMLVWIERRHRLILLAMLLLFVAALFGGLTIKLQQWGQGYDQIDYQQSIWNTTQGRFLETTHYRHTDSLWGMDFIPAILLIVPFYAIAPSALTLNFFQALCIGLGALPTYAIARDRFHSKAAGLGWAAIYLLYPSTWFVTMSAPWQPRTLAVPLLIGAFYFLQRATSPLPLSHAGAMFGRCWWGFMLCLLAALTTRTDASLCVLAFGLLAAIWRMGWRWALPPIVVAVAWFVISTSILVPMFYRSDYVPHEIRGSADACADYSKNWPGKSPQLAYYCHLGSSTSEIIVTILTQPLKVAQIVFIQPKMLYLLLMFLPLLFLPLLAPDALLPALPILAMNLLTNRPFQYTVREQYQTLVIPGLIIAAIVGSARLLGWWQQRQQRRIGQDSEQQRVGSRFSVLGARRSVRQFGSSAVRQFRSSAVPQFRSYTHLLVAMILFVALINISYKNPVLTTLLYREDPARVATMAQMAKLVPPDAALAVTSFLAPNMMPRREIFYFPNSPSFPPLERAEYLFIDTRAAALETEEGRRVMAEVRSSGAWQVLADKDELLLLKRVH
jgi:uncharacterized membrane protein